MDNIGGWFSMTIDAVGNVYGSYDGDYAGYSVGFANILGDFSASGVAAGGVVWSGTFSLVNASLHGSGTWSAAGCSGTWHGPSVPQ